MQVSDHEGAPPTKARSVQIAELPPPAITARSLRGFARLTTNETDPIEFDRYNFQHMASDLIAMAGAACLSMCLVRTVPDRA